LDDEDYSQMYAAWKVSDDIRGAFTAVDELFQSKPCLFRKPGAASENIQLRHIVSDAPQLDDNPYYIPQSVLLDPQEFAAQNLDHLSQMETHNDNAEAAGRLLTLLHSPPGGVSLRNKNEICCILAQPIAIRSQIIHGEALQRARLDPRRSAEQWEDIMKCSPLEEESMEEALTYFKNDFVANHMHGTTRDKVQELRAINDRKSKEKAKSMVRSAFNAWLHKRYGVPKIAYYLLKHPSNAVDTLLEAWKDYLDSEDYQKEKKRSRKDIPEEEKQKMLTLKTTVLQLRQQYRYARSILSRSDRGIGNKQECDDNKSLLEEYQSGKLLAKVNAATNAHGFGLLRGDESCMLGPASFT
jgi:hypothetical protein